MSALSGQKKLRRAEVKLWDASTGKLLQTLPQRAMFIGSLTFSPDGRWLAIGEEAIWLWDPIARREVRAFTGHVGLINALAFSTDGRLLASGASDGIIKLWDADTGRELRTLIGHIDSIFSLNFSPDGRWLISCGLDGGIRLWETATGELQAMLITSEQEDNWLVITPDGLFDGTPGAWNQILWRFSQNIFDVSPAGTFFNEFFRPGLLADIIAGKKPKAPRNISQLDRRPPQVSLTLADGAAANGNQTSARQLKVKLTVTEAPADDKHASGGGARDLRLFRNGSLVKTWRGELLTDSGRQVVLEATIPLVAGENRLSAYAFNHDNIKSEDATLTITGAENLKRAGTAYILAIGVNEYSNPQYNLKYAVADAQLFGRQLRQEQARLGRFASVEVVPLLNQEATRTNILYALALLAGQAATAPANAPETLQKLKRVEPEDAVIIYFAGHGMAYQNQFYLIPHDLGYSGSRTELDEAGLKTILARSISDRELERAFEPVDAGQLLLVIDACNSGQALEAEEKRRGPMNSKGLAQLAYEKGMYVMTAAQSYQAALEAAQLGHGYLTYALVEEGLKQGAADVSPKDGEVLAREWLDYATERVPQMQEKKMKERSGLKQVKALVFVEGEEKIADVEKRSVQRPRVFYRREPETQPLIIAKPRTK
ncbi:MAG: caspase family protein [Blastocatellia bacterium]